MKKQFNLTQEEEKIEAKLERGDRVSVPVSEEQKKKLAEIAKYTLAKNKAITIRVSERNLKRLKAAAAREGVPYQTLVSSLIQKHT